MDLDLDELRATRILNGVDKEDNTFKISVPIATNEELERLDYKIANDLDNIVNQIFKTVSRDRDIIILKKVIEKQSKEIEELKEDNKHQWEERCKLTFELENSTSNDKIKSILEEYKYTEIGDSEKIIEFYEKMQSLLEKE